MSFEDSESRRFELNIRLSVFSSRPFARHLPHNFFRVPPHKMFFCSLKNRAHTGGTLQKLVGVFDFQNLYGNFAFPLASFFAAEVYL